MIGREDVMRDDQGGLGACPWDDIAESRPYRESETRVRHRLYITCTSKGYRSGGVYIIRAHTTLAFIRSRPDDAAQARDDFAVSTPGALTSGLGVESDTTPPAYDLHDGDIDSSIA